MNVVMGRLILCVLLLCLGSGVFAQTKDEYELGAGDVVRVTVFGHNDLNAVARINEPGRINFPLLGEIEIGGLTISKAEQKLAKALKSGGFVKTPQVGIVVEQFRSRQVSVLGEVNKPGKYSIDGLTTVVDLIAMAGGVTPKGAETVRLIRTGQDNTLQEDVDLNAIFYQGELDRNVEVKNGDIVYVPVMDRFYIYGEVQRPGVYRLEKNMTVMQALAVGGGLTSRGTDRGIMVKRRESSSEIKEHSVALTDAVQSNDVIYIKEGFF
jgi:polysaccharide export outer membrane protein